MKKPNLGWTTIVKVKDIIDGDTIKVVIEKEITVRITDSERKFNTSEIRKPASEEEIKKGKEAKAVLEQLILADDNEHVLLYVPTDGRNHLSDVFSIGSRVVGHIFLGDEDITDIMKRLGFDKSTITKEREDR